MIFEIYFKKGTSVLLISTHFGYTLFFYREHFFSEESEMFSMENRQRWSQNVLYVKMFSIFQKWQKRVIHLLYHVVFYCYWDWDTCQKRGNKSQKVFFMKFAGQSEMFSLKNRRTQSLFLKNMFSIKKRV